MLDEVFWGVVFYVVWMSVLWARVLFSIQTAKDVSTPDRENNTENVDEDPSNQSRLLLFNEHNKNNI